MKEIVLKNGLSFSGSVTNGVWNWTQAEVLRVTSELDRERESMLSKHEDELRQYDIGVILQLDQKVSEQQVVT